MSSISSVSVPLSRDRGSASQVASNSIGLHLAVVEVIAIIVISLGAQAVYTSVFWASPRDLDTAAGMGLVLAAIFVPIAHARGLYKSSRISKGDRIIRSVAAVWISAFLIASMAAFLFKVGDHFSRAVTGTLFLCGFGVLVLLRYLAASALKAGIGFGTLRPRRAVMFFDPETDTEEVAQDLRRHGYRIISCIPLRRAGPTRSDGWKPVDDIIELVRSRQLDEAFITAPLQSAEELNRLMADFRRVSLPVHLIPSPEIRALLDRPLIDYGAVKAFELQRTPLAASERAAKRSLDIVFAAAALICLWPLFLMVAAAIKLDSRGPVFFAQKRVGFNGRVFRIFKFRSMTSLDDGPVVQQAKRGDARVTAVGRWIRASSIDELPQLFNVLKGDMSLIGPRPHVIAHDNEYSALIADYAMRHHVKPGITGLAQVTGCRGETATPDLMARRVEHDLWYIANWSLWLDLGILVRTVFVVCNTSKTY